MKKYLVSLIALIIVSVPSSVDAAYNVGWYSTSTNPANSTWISPIIVNGIFQIPAAQYFIATSTTKASTFPYASTTALTVSGNSYLGTVSSGTWNGTAIGFGFGGTGLTSASDDTTLVSSGSAWVASAIPNCTDTGGNHLNYTTASNSFSCGTSGSGGGGGTDGNWSFFNGSGIRLATSSNQILGSSGTHVATTTLAKLEVGFNSVSGGSIFAYGSTTLQDVTAVRATTTSATTTNLSVTTGLSLPSGSVTNAFLVNSTISGISLGSNLAALTAGTGITSAGTYTGATARTFSVDQTFTPTWTGLHIFQAGLISQASSTISALTVTNGTTTNATSTNLLVSGTASTTNLRINGYVSSAKIDTAFMYATSTLGTGTTTLKIAGFKQPTSFLSFGCNSRGSGTFTAQLGDSNSSSTMIVSSTGLTTTFTALSSNNAFTSGESVWFSIGNVSGTVVDPTCSYQRAVTTAD